MCYTGPDSHLYRLVHKQQKGFVLCMLVRNECLGMDEISHHRIKEIVSVLIVGVELR